jgi:uncharacterized protein YxjI
LAVSQLRQHVLDPAVDYYVLKEDWWNWGSGNIFDRQGTTIGHMHRRKLSLRALTEVKDVAKVLVFSVERKLVSIRASYVIKDPHGTVLGRTNRKILAFFRPKLWLEDARGQKIMEAQGNFLGKNFTIKDSKGKSMGRVGKSDFFRDLIVGGSLFDFTDTYAVNVLDTSVDRRLLLGFVIAIDNSAHDKR